MATIDDLKTWFERDIKFATWEENVQVENSDPAKLELRLYTDTNEYLITITPQEEDSPRIDCSAKSRKSRPGINSPRVRQVLGGRPRRLNERVWRRILGAIVGVELVRVHRPDATEKGSPETEERTEDEAVAAD